MKADEVEEEDADVAGEGGEASGLLSAFLKFNRSSSTLPASMWRTDRRQNPVSSALMMMRTRVTTDGKRRG